MFSSCGFEDTTEPRLIETIVEESVGYSIHTAVYFDFFDTLLYLRIFAQSREEFENYASAIYNEVERLHKLFDIFNEYEGISNIKTINQMAGIAPVVVDEDIFSLIEFGIEAYNHSGGAVNITMGGVLALWRDFLQGKTDSVPSIEVLEAYALLSNIKDIVLAQDESSVFLTRAGMRLDVGAFAKGYALEKVAALAIDLGLQSGIINMGGDMRLIGAPLDGRRAWVVGVENPLSDETGHFGTVEALDVAIATSGDYKRYTVYNDNKYHHIIDPNTLMPAQNFSSVTIIHPDARQAEFLSTAAFVLPLDDAVAVVKNFGGEGLWILPDGSYFFTDGFNLIKD